MKRNFTARFLNLPKALLRRTFNGICRGVIFVSVDSSGVVGGTARSLSRSGITLLFTWSSGCLLFLEVLSVTGFAG